MEGGGRSWPGSWPWPWSFFWHLRKADVGDVIEGIERRGGGLFYE